MEIQLVEKVKKHKFASQESLYDETSSNQSESDLELHGPIETNQRFDGWKLYKRLKVPAAPVRQYQNLIDEDY